jgi:hypothetical protein
LQDKTIKKFKLRQAVLPAHEPGAPLLLTDPKKANKIPLMIEIPSGLRLDKRQPDWSKKPCATPLF